MIYRSIILGGALFLGTSLDALTPNEWRFAMPIDLPVSGLVRLQLPPGALDISRPNLEDLRVVDSAGDEVPYLLDRPAPRIESVLRPKELRTELLQGSTRITLTTGSKSALKGLILETPPGAEFIKAVNVEGLHDGKNWQPVVNGQPIFRMAGSASNLHISVPEGIWESLRLTIDDSRATAVPFTGVQLEVAEVNPPAKPFPVAIKSRDESFGETRLDLDLGASNLPVATLRIDTNDPLFARTVTLGVRNLANDTIQEQRLCSGTIYRVDLNGKVESRLDIPVEMQVPSRDLILLIDNGDSPPLKINSIQGERRIISAVFLARDPGKFVVLSGNNQCPAPRYDLTGLSGQLKAAPATEVQASDLKPNAGYSAPDNLASVPMEGAQIDLGGWKFHKKVVLQKAGAQQLELDPEVLARAAPDFRDVRIVNEDRQIPFVFERTSISRSIPLESSPVKDPKFPRLSRWSLKMPLAGVPITRVTCSSGSALFEREIRLWENVRDDRGDEYPRELGRARWKRVPNQPLIEFAVTLISSPTSSVLFLETDNGDNPAIELRDFRAHYPVTRAVFKTGSDSTLSIYYGNPEILAPRYDVSLIADQLLRAERGSVILGAQGGSGVAVEKLTQSLGGVSRYIFWGVLALVVIGLLFLISRLLPKSS